MPRQWKADEYLQEQYPDPADAFQAQKRKETRQEVTQGLAIGLTCVAIIATICLGYAILAN